MKRNLAGFATVAACALLLQGCALVLLGAGGAGGVAAADSMQSADRTFTYPLEQVHTATTQALARMSLRPSEDTTTAEGRRIVAHAGGDRTIDIELENVTYNTTRMTVQVKTYHGLLRDGATASQIVQSTGDTLASAGPMAPPAGAAAYQTPAYQTPQPLDTQAQQPSSVAPPPGPSPAIESQPLQ